MDIPDARRLTRHGIVFGLLVAALTGTLVFLGRVGVVGLYTGDPAVAAAALSLLAWVTLFHVVDAGQALASFVLRAYRIATVPMFIFAASLWGVGLGGGYVLAFNVTGGVPSALQGAPGYWAASTAGLALAMSLLMAVVWQVMRRQKQQGAVAAPA